MTIGWERTQHAIYLSSKTNLSWFIIAMRDWFVQVFWADQESIRRSQNKQNSWYIESRDSAVFVFVFFVVVDYCFGWWKCDDDGIFVYIFGRGANIQHRTHTILGSQCVYSNIYSQIRDAKSIEICWRQQTRIKSIEK